MEVRSHFEATVDAAIRLYASFAQNAYAKKNDEHGEKYDQIIAMLEASKGNPNLKKTQKAARCAKLFLDATQKSARIIKRLSENSRERVDLKRKLRRVTKIKRKIVELYMDFQ